VVGGPVAAVGLGIDTAGAHFDLDVVVVAAAVGIVDNHLNDR
jgi:hypothetical protein